MLLIAIRQLCGDYGVVAPGARFDCPPRESESLMSRGLARLYMPPVIEAAVPIYETKVAVPEETKAPPPPAPSVIVIAAPVEPELRNEQPRHSRRRR